jgi:hypothetical protein
VKTLGQDCGDLRHPISDENDLAILHQAGALADHEFRLGKIPPYQ